jgi:hypothetical protein
MTSDENLLKKSPTCRTSREKWQYFYEGQLIRNAFCND